MSYLDIVPTRKYNEVYGTRNHTKTGNSYAIRVPKRYIDDNNLKLGDVVNVEEPLVKQRQALDALMRHGKKHGSIKGISDPVTWQREQRTWEERRKNTEDDSARH